MTVTFSIKTMPKHFISKKPFTYNAVILYNVLEINKIEIIIFKNNKTYRNKILAEASISYPSK